MSKPRLVKPADSLPVEAVSSPIEGLAIRFPQDSQTDAIHLVPSGVVVLGSPSFGDYEDAMRTAVYLTDKAPFWKADLIAYAYTRKDWAGLIDAVIDAGTFTRATVAQYKYVANAVPPKDRVEGLSFSHHEAVASLATPDKRRYLERAKREHLSVSALKQVVRKDKKVRKVLKGQASELAKAHDAVAESAFNAAHACKEIAMHDCQDGEKKIKLARRYLDACEAALVKLRKAQGKQ